MKVSRASLAAFVFGMVSGFQLESDLKDATMLGDAQGILSLVQQGVDPDVVFEDQQTPLIKLCELGDIPSVVKLVKMGADVDYYDVLHCPLAIAIKSGNADLVRTLVHLGCGRYGLQLTKLAITENVLEVAKIMVDKFAFYPKNSRLEYYVDILFYASLSDNRNPEIFDYMITKAPLDGYDMQRKQMIFKFVLETGNDSCWRSLIDSGILCGLENQNGMPILIEAVNSEQIELVTKLLGCGHIDINHRDRKGNGAVHYAHTEDMIDVLVGGGVDLEQRNKDGQSPLLQAMLEGKWAIAKILVLKGANLTNYDRKGRNFLRMSLPNHRPDPDRMSLFLAILRSTRFDLEPVYEETIRVARVDSPLAATFLEKEFKYRKIMMTFFIGHLFDPKCAIHDELFPADVAIIILKNFIQLTERDFESR